MRMSTLPCFAKRLLAASIAVTTVVPQAALARQDGIAQKTQLSSNIHSENAMDDSSAQPSQEDAPELNRFAQALLDNAIRLAREIESPVERANALIYGSIQDDPESIRSLLEEAHQAILQIDSAVVRIEKLGELAEQYWHNHDRAIALLQEAEQLIPLLSDDPEKQDHARSELSFHDAMLAERQKLMALSKNLPASPNRQLAQEPVFSVQSYGTDPIALSNATENLLAIQRLLNSLDGDAPSLDEASDTQLMAIVLPYIQVNRIEEANVVIEELQTRFNQMPLSPKRLNSQISLASLFQDFPQSRERWSATLNDAVATYKLLQTQFHRQLEPSLLSYDLERVTNMLRELGRTEEAIALLQASPTQEESIENQVERLLNLAAAYREINQIDSALETLNQAAQRSQANATDWNYPPEQTWRQIQVANEYLALKQPKAAWQTLKPIWHRVKSMEHDDPEAAEEYIEEENQRALFESLVELGRTEEAIAFAQATDLEDLLPDLVLNLAKQGNLETAVNLTQSLKEPETTAEAWTYLATVYGSHNQLEKADQALQQAVASSQASIDAYDIYDLASIAYVYNENSSPEQVEAQARRLKNSALRAALLNELLKPRKDPKDVSPALADLQLETLQQLPIDMREQGEEIEYWSSTLLYNYAHRQDYGKAIALIATLDGPSNQVSALVGLLETYLEQDQPELDNAALEKQLQAL